MTKVQLPHEVGVQFDEALAANKDDFDITMLGILDVDKDNPYPTLNYPTLNKWWNNLDNLNVTQKLLDAYENGWEDEKPKTFRVPVPHTQGNSIYIHTTDNAGGERPLGVTNVNDVHENSKFTLDQIKHFGLVDLPRYEVANA